MIGALKDAYNRLARQNKRAALSAELDDIYASRRFFDKREKEIVHEAKQLDTQEVHHVIKTRQARAW